MRPAAALLLGAALVATSCGAGKPSRSAADVAPRETAAFITLGSKPETEETRSALALLPGGMQAQALLDRVAWAGITRPVDVAILASGQGVAYALPKDRDALNKRLDSKGLLRARIRGWTAFTRNAAALEAAKRAKTRLVDATWFAAARRVATGNGSAVLTHAEARWTAIAADAGRVRRTTPGGGVDSRHRLAARVPENTVIAAAAHDFGAELRSLPFASVIRRGFGLELDVLARATPGNAVVYLGAGLPFPTVTLVAEDGSIPAAERVVHQLDPRARPPVPVTIGGTRLNDVALGALDLYYGRHKGDLVVTNDSTLDLQPSNKLEPAGLPAKTGAWIYIDAERAPTALQSLAALAGMTFSPELLNALQGLHSVLAFVTHTRTTTSVTLSILKMQ